MSRLKKWRKVKKDEKLWKQKNKGLGSDAEGINTDVEVWEHTEGDIIVTLYKHPRYEYKISLDGSDQSRTDIQTINFGTQNYSKKKEAIKNLKERLKENENVMGLMAEPENKHKVWEVDVGQYHTQGMGAVSYATKTANNLADKLEEELGVRTTVGDLEDRKFRKNTKGGNYGGKIPVYADEPIDKDTVREIKYSN